MIDVPSSQDIINNAKSEDAIIEITITNKCNGTCVYCFEEKRYGNATQENEQLQTNLIYEFCQDYGYKYKIITIVFWGGEPLLNLNFIYNIIDKTKDFTNVRYFLYSNGLEIKSWNSFIQSIQFKDVFSRLTVRLSYDGYPHHNIYRNNDGMEIIKLYFKLKELNIQKVFFSGTIKLSACEMLPYTWDSFYELYKKDNTIKYRLNLDTMDNDIKYIDIFKSSLHFLVKKEYDFFMKHGDNLCIWFSNNICKETCRLTNRVALHTDGNIYNCHGGQYSKWCNNIKLGNIFTTNSLSTYIKKINLGEKNHKCANCEATSCLVCHISQIKNPNNNNDLLTNWESCRSLNSNRCKYYRLMGKCNCILQDAIKKNDIKLLDNILDINTLTL